MSGRKKKQHHEEHPDERWLITYADVLTLMFVLFMVLFSISVVNTGKFEQLKESLSEAFSPGIFPGGESVLEQGSEEAASPIVQTPPGVVAPTIATPLGVSLNDGGSTAEGLESAQLADAKSTIDEKVSKAGLSEQISTKVDERGLTIRLRTDPFLFGSGSAAIRPEARRLLLPVASAVKGLPNPVQIEGHTDSRPIRTAQFPSNWWLGGGRACAVLEALGSGGVPQTRMTCTSRAATVPVADNGTEAGRAQNRRVEILVVRVQGSDGTTTTP